ncbi:uncharacterized protein LOC129606495 [Condylostylus longicornis]|uniref:uncharacterized protein LOC129606495 n=1 Tax=Condylostylus longicornis TaxID=2530218 RepID=UPI00244DF22E|nr:uncharacterized protein LOC129606495 [Condylostylus longicornis]
MANIRSLPPALAKKAAEELGEVPSRIQEDLQALKDWIEKQPHLKARTSDQFLIAFLRGCKYSLERTKEKLDKFYSLRAGIQDIFRNRVTDDPKCLEILRTTVAFPLPKTIGEDGPRIRLTRSGQYDPDKYTFAEIVKVQTIITEIEMLEDDNFVVAGCIEILDLANVTKKHLLHLDLNVMKKVSVYSDKAMPVRQKGVHFINLPNGFFKVFNIIKAFQSEKIKRRIFVHNERNMESLYEHISQDYLPVEYGGNNGTISDIIDYWEKKIIEYRDYFIEEDNYGSNEKLRIGTPIDFNSYFGIDGSFRKLEIMIELRQLPSALAKKAAEELDEVPSRIQDDLQALKTFLRGCQYSLERAKEKIDKFYSLRAGLREIFRNRKTDNQKILELLRAGSTLPLPNTIQEDGPRIRLTRFGLDDDNLIVAGTIEILDAANVSKKHFLSFDLNIAKKISVYGEKAVPVRQKGIYFINLPNWFFQLYEMLKNFQSEKIRNRMFLYSENNIESLYENIPKKYLPVEYGGENGTIPDIIDYWERKFIEYRDYFNEEENYGSNEKLRIAKKASEELGEVPSRIQEDLQVLKDWIEKQPHLKARTSDQFLIAFLRGCKYSLERAKEKIDKFYSLRSGIQNVLQCRRTDDQKILEILRTSAILPLPKTIGDDGPLIRISRFGKCDPDKYSFVDTVKVQTIINEILLLENDNYIVAGCIEILDFIDISSKHILNMDLNIMKKISVYSENAMPLRRKGFHFVNLTSSFFKIFNIVKNFQSEKTRSRICVHSERNMESLYEKIPKEYLPVEYGGNNGTIPDIIEYWERKFNEYRDYFIEEDNYGSNENLRIGTPIDFNSYFGVDGSFRKLEID